MEEVFKVTWAGMSESIPFGPLMIGDDYYNEEEAKRFIKEFVSSQPLKDDEFNASYFKIDKFYKFEKDGK